MSCLLDTHILLWAAADSPRLPAEARSRIENRDSEVWFSAVSIWEVAIKRSRGRDDFDVDPSVLLRGLRENGYREVAVTARHAAAVDALPRIHSDPFDRLLVVQAQLEALTLLTADRTLGRYQGSIELVSPQGRRGNRPVS